MPKRRSASKSKWPPSDRTRKWAHIWLIPKPDTHCARSATWLYGWKEKIIPHCPYTHLFSIIFLSFLLPIPAPYLSSPSLPLFNSPPLFLPFLLFLHALSLIHWWRISQWFLCSKTHARHWRCKSSWESHPVLEEFSICLGCILTPHGHLWNPRAGYWGGSQRKSPTGRQRKLLDRVYLSLVLWEE